MYLPNFIFIRVRHPVLIAINQLLHSFRRGLDEQPGSQNFFAIPKLIVRKGVARDLCQEALFDCLREILLLESYVNVRVSRVEMDRGRPGKPVGTYGVFEARDGGTSYFFDGMSSFLFVSTECPIVVRPQRQDEVMQFVIRGTSLSNTYFERIVGAFHGQTVRKGIEKLPAACVLALDVQLAVSYVVNKAA
jgi:hypothetical protein